MKLRLLSFVNALAGLILIGALTAAAQAQNTWSLQTARSLSTRPALLAAATTSMPGCWRAILAGIFQAIRRS
jgi:hypothetical protein